MIEARELTQQQRVSLKHARSQLRLQQKQLAQLAELHPNVIWRSENGHAIELTSAYAILDALNKVRDEQGKKPLAFDDIEWRIKGE